MRKYTTVNARNQFSDVINYAAFGKERVALTRRGKVIAYVVPAEDVEILEAMEDESDIKAAEEVLERIERGEEKIYSLEEVVAELRSPRKGGTKKRKTA